jgi:cytochrome P450
MWVVTRYDDVSFIYANPGIFSSASVLSPRTDIPTSIVAEFGGWSPPIAQMLVMTDAPQHTRLRQLMMKAFTPARVSQFEPWIVNIENALMDGFIEGKKGDFVGLFTSRVPTDAIGRILGVPSEDARMFATWVGDLNNLAGTFDLDEQTMIACWRGVRDFENYAMQLIADRRKAPREDVVSYFIDAKSEDGSPALSDTELLHNVLNVAAAGSETSGVLLAVMIYLLLIHPDQWDEIKRNSALIPGAIEESLRFGGVVRGLIRRTTQDVTLGGQQIREGDFVYFSLASANRDHSVFLDGDTFNIYRQNARRHLGLGGGIHNCLGASLARLEAKIGIKCLIERMPNLALAEDHKGLEYRANIMIPPIKSLEVTW